MRVQLNSETFVEITSPTAGTIQNISPSTPVEIASTEEAGTGIVLQPYERLQYDDSTSVYARSVWDDDDAAYIVAEPFKRSGEGGGGSSYTLPAATASKLGGVKIGSNVTVQNDGTISVPAPYLLPTAAADTLGGVKVGSGLSITDGVLSATGGGSGGDPVGRVVFDVILRDGYIKANGATVSDASTSIPNLLTFVQTNPSLLANNQADYDANHGLYLYDSGTDTLTLPNFIGKFVEGGNTVEEKEAGIPNIKGQFIVRNLSDGTAAARYDSDVLNNSFENTIISQTSGTGIGQASGNGWQGISFDASNSNPTYSDSVNTVQPPSITLIPQIKY